MKKILNALFVALLAVFTFQRSVAAGGSHTRRCEKN